MNRSLLSSPDPSEATPFDAAMAGRAARRLPLRLPLDYLLAGCAGLLTFALGLYGAGSVSLWYDEAYSVGLASQPWHVMWHYTWGREANMALYYVLLHVWLGLTGALGAHPAELVVRLPSVACAALAAAVLFLLGRRLLGRTAALVATALYTLDYLQLYAAHQARAYSLELLLIVIGWYALCAALQPVSTRQRSRQGWWAVYVAAMTLAVYAHLFSLLIWAAQAVAVAGLLLLPGPWRASARASVRSALLGLVAVLVLSLPMLIDAALHGGASVWVPPVHLRDVYAFLLLLSGTAKSLALLGVSVALALLAALLPRLSRAVSRIPQNGIDGTGNAGAWRRSVVYVLLCWLLGPVVLSYVTTQQGLNLHLFYARYLVVVVPPLCLLVAMGAMAPRPWLVRAVLAALLVATAASHARNYYATAQSQDFRTPALWLQSQARSGDGIVCAPLVSCAIPLGYYLRAYPGPARLDAGAPGRWSWSGDASTPLTTPALVAYARQHRRIFLVDAAPESTSGVAPRRWLDAHGRLVARFTGTTVTIRLYALSR